MKKEYSNIYCITFPITNYYADDIFNKNLYVKSNRCPTLEEVREILYMLSEEEEKFVENIGEWRNCIKCLDSVEKFPCIDDVGGVLIEANSFCKTNFGRKPLTIKRLVIACLH